MKDKRDIKLIVIISIIALIIIFSKNIRYFFTGDKDLSIAVPTGFYFEIMDKGNGDLYEIDGSDSKEYITVDKKYLNNDDTQIYVSGRYWNSPEKPLVKFNGKVVDGVTSSDTGYADGVFSDYYYSKCYHFTINETIEEDKEYTFYVRIRNESKSIKVIFTTRETFDGDLVIDEDENEEG